jgi:Domain of unknown function (DUF4402)
MMRRTALLLALCVLLVAAPAYAVREYTVVRHLSFGTFSAARNNATLRVTVAPDSSTSYDAGLYPDTAAQPAEYLLTGLPPNMKITLGTGIANPPTDGGLIIDNVSALSSPGSPSFTVGTFTCNNPTTDGAGNATLLIGATLTTTGGGGYYQSGAYTGALDLTFYLD